MRRFRIASLCLIPTVGSGRARSVGARYAW